MNDKNNFTEFCLVSWDEFYHENYNWALRCISGHIDDFTIARKVLDTIFMNLTLDRVEIQDEKDFKSKLSLKLAGVISRINQTERRKKYHLQAEIESSVFY